MTRLLTLIFFSAFMMATVKGHAAGNAYEWEAHQRGQDRRLDYALAKMGARGRAAEIELDRRALELERRRVALEETKYRDARAEKARARQKEQEKEEAARKHQQRKVQEAQALPYLLDWKKKLDAKPTYALADDFVRKAVAEYNAAQETHTHLPEDLVAQLLDRKIKTDTALRVVAEDLRKGTHKGDPDYEEKLKKRYTGGHGYATFTWEYVTSLLERERKIAERHKYGIAVWEK